MAVLREIALVRDTPTSDCSPISLRVKDHEQKATGDGVHICLTICGSFKIRLTPLWPPSRWGALRCWWGALRRSMRRVSWPRNPHSRTTQPPPTRKWRILICEVGLGVSLQCQNEPPGNRWQEARARGGWSLCRGPFPPFKEHQPDPTCRGWTGREGMT